MKIMNIEHESLKCGVQMAIDATYLGQDRTNVVSRQGQNENAVSGIFISGRESAGSRSVLPVAQIFIEKFEIVAYTTYFI